MRTWIKNVEEERKRKKVSLRREEALCRAKSNPGVNLIVVELRLIWQASLVGYTTRFMTLVCLSHYFHTVWPNPVTFICRRYCYARNVGL